MCDACNSHLTKTQRRQLRLSAAVRTAGKAGGKALAWSALDEIKRERESSVQAAAQSVIDDMLADALRQVSSSKTIKRDTPADGRFSVELSFELGAWITAMEDALSPALLDAVLAGWRRGRSRQA